MPHTMQGETPKENEIVELFECYMCERKFNQNAILQHEELCQKVFNGKKKQLNKQQTRIASKEPNKESNKMEEGKEDKPKKQKPNWKQQSAAFRAKLASHSKVEEEDVVYCKPPPNKVE